MEKIAKLICNFFEKNIVDTDDKEFKPLGEVLIWWFVSTLNNTC